MSSKHALTAVHYVSKLQTLAQTNVIKSKTFNKTCIHFAQACVLDLYNKFDFKFKCVSTNIIYYTLNFKHFISF